MGCIGKKQVYGSQDAEYLKKLDAERIALSGTTVEYYSLNRGRNVDPLYGEPNNDPLYGGQNISSVEDRKSRHDRSWNFCPNIIEGDDPFEMLCAMEYTESENRAPSVRTQGKMVEYDAILIIADVHWECGILESGITCLQNRRPKEGDVLYGFYEWWDVVRAGRSGYILGTPVSTGYRLELKKRTQFSPERKVVR